VVAEFRALGRIEVVADGHRLEVGHARRQAVLAVLLTELNRVVPVDQLVERVWGEEPAPRDPRGVLRTYLWHLRRAFADLRDVALVRRAPGYELAADERQVDLHRFRALLARTHSAGDDDRRAALLEQALALWRGEPFAGLDSPWIDLTRRNLHLRHHMARLELTDIDLRRGRHTTLLSELTGQTAEHPLDERIAGQLMLALHRSGRSADAFAEYRRIRGQLADELGADPGPALRGVHQQILTTGTVHARATGTVRARDAPEGAEVRAPSTGPAAPAAPLTAPTGAATAAFQHPGIPVPRQLPAPPWSFTGRVRELDALDATLEERSGPGRVLCISGLGGMGKTWLALHWAQQNLDRFPDGQLYADMRGFAPSGPPASPRTAIHAFLHALGAAPANVPAHLNARVGHYRSLLADRRMLIVLDNVRDAQQVVPLLPGSGACTVLITGRHRLTGLVTGHGARHLALDVLPEDDARLLLARRLGGDRVDAERPRSHR
jgi:DNA-binding SARP family transcriptional activator